MLKDTGYIEKIELLRDWLEEIVDIIKKDLKNEHLKIDKEFCRKYFLGKSCQSLTLTEMATAYAADIKSGNSGLGEFIASRWLLKNTDIYHFFEEKLKKIAPDFEALDELSQEQGQQLMNQAKADFGPIKTYIFSVFNSVVFPKSIYDELKEHASFETQRFREKTVQENETKNLEELKKRYDRDISALTDRYEKKLIGMQKKYLHDTESLKKQISTLQRKLDSRNELSK